MPVTSKYVYINASTLKELEKNVNAKKKKYNYELYGNIQVIPLIKTQTGVAASKTKYDTHLYIQTMVLIPK